jgi:hypothetical protein
MLLEAWWRNARTVSTVAGDRVFWQKVKTAEGRTEMQSALRGGRNLLRDISLQRSLVSSAKARFFYREGNEVEAQSAIRATKLDHKREHTVANKLSKWSLAGVGKEFGPVPI